MEAAAIVFQQIVTMFLYMLAGYLLVRTGKLSTQGSRDLATMLIWLVIPAMMVNSFCVAFSAERLKELALSSLLGAAALAVSLGLARLLMHKNAVEEFAAAFSNAGFIGIPLVSASLGSDAVFFIVGFIALLNILQWTYGVQLFTGKRGRLGLKGLLLNPIMVSMLLGLLLFLTGLGARLPAVLSGAVKGIAALNAPIAMLVLGAYFARVDVGAMFRKRRLYLLSAVRLLLIPMVTLLVFRLTGLPQRMCLAVLISASAPVGANVAVYAQLHDQDYSYACETVVLTTLLSLVFLPLILLIAGRI